MIIQLISSATSQPEKLPKERDVNNTAVFEVEKDNRLSIKEYFLKKQLKFEISRERIGSSSSLALPQASLKNFKRKEMLTSAAVFKVEKDNRLSIGETWRTWSLSP